jgi:hypothetical protein
MTLSMTTVVILFVAVVANSSDLTIVAAIVAAFSVLLGVAVDVMDSERGVRRDPGAMAAHPLTQ